MSASQIAERLDFSKTFVLDRLHELGIRVKTGKSRVNNPENFRSRTPPYEWKIRNGKLTPFKGELVICRYVVNLIRDGHSYRSAALELTKLRFRNRKGKINWEHSTAISIYKQWNEKL